MPATANRAASGLPLVLIINLPLECDRSYRKQSGKSFIQVTAKNDIPCKNGLTILKAHKLPKNRSNIKGAFTLFRIVSKY